jgi:hypothetical protein
VVKFRAFQNSCAEKEKLKIAAVLVHLILQILNLTNIVELFRPILGVLGYLLPESFHTNS